MDIDLTEIAYDVIVRSSRVPASGKQSGQVGSRGQYVGIKRNKSALDSIAPLFENETGQVTGHVLKLAGLVKSCAE
jgi:hypothetical protein